ncbi:hypothetical protein AWW66_22900 [Micromonospora rosaria]|uniref:Uncharacterized protein n=1 Tax=Micromonospora rosaria TaxID=47874 RepID=A0A136PMY2_9ACTN|nr:hypothetical protein AWW66_22900 [Micromonospora rosaria]
MVYDVDGNRIACIDSDGQASVFVSGHELTVAGQDLSATRYYEHAGDVVAYRSASTVTGARGVVWVAADHHDSALWALHSVTRVESVRYADPYGVTRTGSADFLPSVGQREFVGGGYRSYRAFPAGRSIL